MERMTGRSSRREPPLRFHEASTDNPTEDHLSENVESRKRKVYGQLFVKNRNLDIKANLTPSQTLRRAAFDDNRSNGNAVVHTATTKDFKEVAHGNEAGVVEHVVNAGERWIAYLCIAGVVEPHYGHLLRNFDPQLNKGVEPGKGHKVIGKYNGIGLGAAFDKSSV